VLIKHKIRFNNNFINLELVIKHFKFQAIVMMSMINLKTLLKRGKKNFKLLINIKNITISMIIIKIIVKI
jgi:hypothetical protein